MSETTLRNAARIALLLFAGAAGAGPTLFDPMRPPPAATASESRPETTGEPSLPRLQALISRGGRRLALIDGRLLAAGDRLGGYRVIAIDRRGARLSGPRGPLELRLPLPPLRPEETP